MIMKMMDILTVAALVLAVSLFIVSFSVKGRKTGDKAKNEKMAKNMKIASAVLGAVGLVGLAMHHKKSGAAGSTKYYYF